MADIPVAEIGVVKEHFPRIAETISMIWGHKECYDYLNRLIIDDRHDRAGFPPAVVKALIELCRVHPIESKTPWDCHINMQ